MTLESDRPERGSDDRHNTPAFGASGALPPFLENVSLANDYYYYLLFIIIYYYLLATIRK